MRNKYLLGMLSRYLIILLLALGNLYLFYAIFTPLTVYPSYIIIKLISQSAQLINPTTIKVLNYEILFIPACIAGSAYFLLFLLNLTAPMPVKVRVKSLAFLVCSFLILNIFRITLFTILFVSEFAYFGIFHLAFWYAGSTIFVAVLWFVNVKIFKIKSIPGFTDINNLLKEARRR